jgi:hypothetical protein
LGDKTTILKAHWGQFTEAMLTKMIDRLNPVSARSDYISYYWDVPSEEWVEFARNTPIVYEVADGLKHPYMNQFTVGVERELFKDTSLSLTYVSRDWKNPIGVYDTATTYELVTIDDPDYGSYQVYQRTSGDAHHYVIANIKEGDPWILENPYRNYRGLEVLFNKRFSNRWQLLASYVYGKAKGTIDNAFATDIGGWSDGTADPNSWILADGTLTNDPTHMIKLQGTYVLPWGINFNASFSAITGNAWTTQYRTDRLAQGRVTIFAESRGSHHYEMQKTLDIRLEKTFLLKEKYKLGLILDVFNVFNDDSIGSWGTVLGYTYFPGDWASTDGHQLSSLALPRRARLGIRLTF